jgi:Flp pilus assembly protein TadD
MFTKDHITQAVNRIALHTFTAAVAVIILFTLTRPASADRSYQGQNQQQQQPVAQSQPQQPQMQNRHEDRGRQDYGRQDHSDRDLGRSNETQRPYDSIADHGAHSGPSIADKGAMTGPSIADVANPGPDFRDRDRSSRYQRPVSHSVEVVSPETHAAAAAAGAPAVSPGVERQHRSDVASPIVHTESSAAASSAPDHSQSAYQVRRSPVTVVDGTTRTTAQHSENHKQIVTAVTPPTAAHQVITVDRFSAKPDTARSIAPVSDHSRLRHDIAKPITTAGAPVVAQAATINRATSPMARAVVNKSAAAAPVLTSHSIIENHHTGYNDGHGWHEARWWHPEPIYRHEHREGSFLNVTFGTNYGCWSPAYASWCPIIYDPFYPLWDPYTAYEPTIVTTCPVAYEPEMIDSTYYGGTAVYTGYRRTILYSCGPSYTVSYVYPHYFHRYVFVSVGGYWPCYSYARYYWYGCHPYVWYGATPTACVVGSTENIYTYDTPAPLVPGTTVAGVQVPDYDGLNAIGQKIKTDAAVVPPTQPDQPTDSDRLFDDGVKAFEAKDYATAIEKLRLALRLDPNDEVLPFAYAQALFAASEYEKAAAVIYTALSEMAPKQQEVYYPRGMYKDEAELNAQIKNLERAVSMDPANAELQLLLGYQFLGIGKYDAALVPLQVAQRNARTAAPASSLILLLEKVQTRQK